MRWLTFGLAIVLAGCGGGAGSRPPSNSDNLADLKELLEELQSQKKKPPAKATELGPLEPVHPMAVRQIQRGDLVYVWGASLGTGQAVLAYPKDAAEKGGAVLLQDGSVKEMTAAEFAAAPKAAGPKK